MEGRSLDPPTQGRDWLALSDAPLDPGVTSSWVVEPSCGAVVTFVGTARDHAGDRQGVEWLEYEAYEEQAMPRLASVARELRRRHPGVGRLALVHRVGRVELTAAAVVVAVSAPHRAEAFDAARYGIDALKASVPIWKREAWRDGVSWGLEAQHLVSPAEVGRPVP